jgi:hypothetical protein
VCPCCSDGPYPLTTIWTTAGETFETTVSRESFKALSKLDDECSLETITGTSAFARATADCASAHVVAKKQLRIPYLIDCSVVIAGKTF